jgi:thiamine-phosphate pyrophosphorylase
VVNLPPLNAIVDEDVAARFGWTVPALARAYLSGGATFLQVRAKRAASGAYLRMCDEVVALGREFAALVIVNDRADIARLAGASGVHVGQQDLPPAAARALLGSGAIVGFSTHTREQVRAALAKPVDYIAVGPVFGSMTKATGYAAVNLEMVRDAARVVNEAGERETVRPIVAIGGITIERAEAVIEAGATTVAVVSDLLATGDPEGRVRAYLELLSGSKTGRGLV